MNSSSNYFIDFSKHISYALENFKNKFSPTLPNVKDSKKEPIVLNDYQIFTSSVFLLEQLKSMMLFWETGFGKTIECIFLIKNVFKLYPSWKIFLFVKSSLRVDPWEKTMEQYLPEEIRKHIFFFHYNLVNTEQHLLLNMANVKDERVFFIFDESHDFIKKILPKENQFNKERRLTKIVNPLIKCITSKPFNRVLFMSATPFSDSVLEFNYILHILRNGNLKLKEDLFNNEGNFKALPLLENLTIGLTSFQKRSESLLFEDVEYKNNLAGKKFVFHKLFMSNFQSDVYKTMYNIEQKNKTRGFRILRRLSNMFVFGDLKIREENITDKDYLEMIRKKFIVFQNTMNQIEFSEKFLNKFKDNRISYLEDTSYTKSLELKVTSKLNYSSKLTFANTYNEEIENLKLLYSYSSKYIKTCQLILQSRGKCVIYQPFVTFEGVKTLIEYFKVFNISFIEYTKNTKLERDSLVLKFNSKENIKGEEIKVCIFSSAGTEGISFLNISDLIIMDFPWSGSELEQIIGRAIRLNSHNDLDVEERYVDIHVLLNYTNNNFEVKSIDEEMLEIIKEKESYKVKFVDLLKSTSIEKIYEKFKDLEPVEKENLYYLQNYRYNIEDFNNRHFSVMKNLIKIKFFLNDTTIETGFLDEETNEIYKNSVVVAKVDIVDNKRRFKVVNNEIVYFICRHTDL